MGLPFSASGPEPPADGQHDGHQPLHLDAAIFKALRAVHCQQQTMLQQQNQGKVCRI